MPPYRAEKNPKSPLSVERAEIHKAMPIGLETVNQEDARSILA